jgi:hypothetical protein
MATKYEPGGVKVTIGRSQDVSLPPRVFRGRATCMHFDTDKSFLLPSSVTGVRNIILFHERHPGMTMLVNGHTDLVGDAQYNLQLSVERAKAVAAYVQDKVDDWLPWYQSPNQSKRWSYTEDQHMLATITDAAGTPYYAGPVTGVNDAATQAAARRFQIDNGLDSDGQLGPRTRRVLVGKYMSLDGTSLPAGAQLEIHGCGKFHPIDLTTAADQDNRRVEIFLFDGPVDPPPQDPCPAPGCTQYPQWVGNPLEDIDLCQSQDFDVKVLVIDRVTQQPVPGASVTTSAPGVAAIVVGGDGRGTLTNVPRGTWNVTATAEGLGADTQPVTVPVDDSTASSSSTSAFAEQTNAPAQPAPPAPKPGGGTVTLQLAALDLAVDWGRRSEKLRSKLQTAGSTSFWLTDTPTTASPGGPATIGVLAASTATWRTDATTPLAKPLALAANKLSAKGRHGIGSAATFLRLDFKMTVTVGSSTETVLAFQQLLSVDPGGIITGVKYAVSRYTLTLAGAATQSGKEGRVPPAQTMMPALESAGLHPLVTIDQKATPATIVVNAEFVDATQLFWSLHAAGDQWRWYLHPNLGGRADNLRVLAWTTGGRPMLWFVAATDAVVRKIDPPGTRQGADLIFFRPPPGSNSFGYQLSKAGFSDPRHQDTTLHILARYLLRPCDTKLIPTLAAQGVQGPEDLGDVMASATTALPSDPMERVSALWTVFQPVGLEAAIAQTQQPHVLFLPLGSDVADPGGYDGALLAGIKTTVASALALLWSTGGVAREANALPAFASRELWLAGHSAGNGALATCAANNGADVDRMITVDATGTFTLKGSVVPAITKAAAARAAAGKGQLEAMVITSPHITDTAIFKPNASAPTMVDFKPVDGSMFVSTKAKVVFIPDLVREPTYWQIQLAPKVAMNAYLHRLLSRWSDAQIAASARNPNGKRANGMNWFFLFFHEYAIFGGHLDTTAGATRVRTFFEDALGSATPATLIVSVLDRKGAPAAGAKVDIVGPVKRRGVTGSSGQVTFDNIEPGTYAITALTTDEFQGTGTASATPGAPTQTTVKATTFMPQSP